MWESYKGMWYKRNGTLWVLKGFKEPFHTKASLIKHIDFIKEPSEKMEQSLKLLKLKR